MKIKQMKRDLIYILAGRDTCRRNRKLYVGAVIGIVTRVDDDLIRHRDYSSPFQTRLTAEEAGRK